MRPLAILLLMTLSAQAEPPPGTDLNSPLSKWYQGLRQPDGDHVSCCSLADCRPTQIRATKDGYELSHDGSWIPVPPGKIIRDVPNRAGEPVACIMNFGGTPIVLCVVLGPQT